MAPGGYDMTLAPLAGCVVLWAPTWLDPELTGLPGVTLAVSIHSWGRVPVHVPGCWSLAGVGKVAGFQAGFCVGVQIL